MQMFWELNSKLCVQDTWHVQVVSHSTPSWGLANPFFEPKDTPDEDKLQSMESQPPTKEKEI